jgi:hypothetical protein
MDDIKNVGEYKEILNKKTKNNTNNKMMINKRKRL